MNWAYTFFGKIANVMNGSQLQLYGAPGSETGEHLYHATRQSRLIAGNDFHYSLGFDGQRFHYAYFANPAEFLSSDPKKKYSTFNGAGSKEIHVMHGFTSEGSSFPKQLPLLNPGEAAKLHVDHIKETWDAAVADKTSRYTPRFKRTNYAPAPNLVAIEEVVPGGALAALKNAVAQGQPCAVHFEPGKTRWFAKKNYVVLGDFARTLEDEAAAKAKKIVRLPTNVVLKQTGGTSVPVLPRTGASGIPPAEDSALTNGGAAHVKRPAATPLPHTTEIPPIAQETEQVESLLEKLGKMKTSSKLAIIGGTVALLATAGYWAFHTPRRDAMQREPKQQEMAALR